MDLYVILMLFEMWLLVESYGSLPTLSSYVFPLQFRKRLAVLSLGLFVRLVAHADLSEGTGVSPLLVNLWTQAQKYRVVDKRLLVSMCVCVLGSLCV